MFGLQTAFFDDFNVLMSSLAENDAERSRNYFKKSALDPKHAKFDKNPSFGHVRAVGGIMGYSRSVNFKHLLRYLGEIRPWATPQSPTKRRKLSTLKCMETAAV